MTEQDNSKTSATDVPQKWHDKLRARGRMSWIFTKELWNDHQFWINAIAAKGGLGALALAGIAALSFTVSLPFFVAAGVVLMAAGLVGIGVYSILAGVDRAKNGLKRAYYKARGIDPPAEAMDNTTLLQKLAKKPAMQKIINHPQTQKLRETKAWKVVEKIRKKQDGVIGGIAAGSSAAYTVIGVWQLATIAAAYTLVALPLAVTFLAATTVASGIYGMYLVRAQFLKRRHKKNDEVAIPPPCDAATSSALDGKKLDFPPAVNENSPEIAVAGAKNPAPKP